MYSTIKNIFFFYINWLNEYPSIENMIIDESDIFMLCGWIRLNFLKSFQWIVDGLMNYFHSSIDILIHIDILNYLTPKLKGKGFLDTQTLIYH